MNDSGLHKVVAIDESLKSLMVCGNAEQKLTASILITNRKSFKMLACLLASKCLDITECAIIIINFAFFNYQIFKEGFLIEQNSLRLITEVDLQLYPIINFLFS